MLVLDLDIDTPVLSSPICVSTHALPSPICLVVSLVGLGLDAKTGLLTGLLTGIQDWKCPVDLSQTCYGSKSLKVILMDSNFGDHPVLNPLVTL
jgi:hypothetical protein